MQTQPFNHDWTFRFDLDSLPEALRQIPAFRDERPVELPHDWSIELPRDPASPTRADGGFFLAGRGTYRRFFEAPEAWQGRKVFLEFEGLYMNAEVWLNDNLLARHPYGYTTFVLDLTRYLKLGQRNELRVFVDNASHLNSRWYSGSGIYRPVWLHLADRVHVAHWGIALTTPRVSAASAEVRVATRVVNESETERSVELHSRILTPEGQPLAELLETASLAAGAEHEFVQTAEVKQPDLWSPDSPRLYRVDTEVRLAGAAVDTHSTTFGIRSLSFRADQGFLLNGQPLKLKGGCLHHDNGVLGAASYPRAEERKVELHKASGFNALRCAHNPPAPAFLEACDRLGMLVIDESFDCWREGKNFYDYHVAFEDWWERDLESMVLRDRNHPSIVLWSVGNELPERGGRSDGARIAKMLVDKVHALDPTRPVTAAMCATWDGSPWESTDAVFATLDVGGYNYRFREYRGDHDRHPQRIMVGLESTPGEAFDTWAEVEALDYVIGDFVWTSLDYLGESGIGRVKLEPSKSHLGAYPWHQANCGDLDLCGFKRPQSHYRDMLWGDGPEVFLAVHHPLPEGKTPEVSYWGWPEVSASWTWPGAEGQTFKVDVYSRCDRVELFLNGTSLGLRPTSRAERFTATWEVPYAPGTLKAVGYRGDRAAVEMQLETACDPVAVRLTPDREVLHADGQDLSYLTVELVDSQGRRHPAADRAICFTVRGEGTLAALGSGDPVSTEDYRGHLRTTYRGRALVVVKSTVTPGELRVSAQADGLEATEVTLRTR